MRYRLLAPLPVTVELFEPGEPAGLYEVHCVASTSERQLVIRRRGRRSQWVIAACPPNDAPDSNYLFEVQPGTIGERVMERLALKRLAERSSN